MDDEFSRTGSHGGNSSNGSGSSPKYSVWELQCLDELECDIGRSSTSSSDDEAPYNTDSAQNLWEGFERNAHAVSQLYKTPQWCVFQTAAGCTTQLYKESLESYRRGWNAGLSHGRRKTLKELIRWIHRYHRRNIHREDLIGFISGKTPPPRPANRSKYHLFQGRFSPGTLSSPSGANAYSLEYTGGAGGGCLAPGAVVGPPHTGLYTSATYFQGSGSANLPPRFPLVPSGGHQPGGGAVSSSGSGSLCPPESDMYMFKEALSVNSPSGRLPGSNSPHQTASRSRNPSGSLDLGSFFADEWGRATSRRKRTIAAVYMNSGMQSGAPAPPPPLRSALSSSSSPNAVTGSSISVSSSPSRNSADQVLDGSGNGSDHGDSVTADLSSSISLMDFSPVVVKRPKLS